MAKAHNHKQQSHEPSQDTAKPNGNLILPGICFICDHSTARYKRIIKFLVTFVTLPENGRSGAGGSYCRTWPCKIPVENLFILMIRSRYPDEVYHRSV